MGSSWSPAFTTAVQDVLRRRVAPEAGGDGLDRLVADLIEALERGELDLPLNPERQAVAEASGWLEGADAVLISQAGRIGWRRWLLAMDAVVEQLLERAMRPGSGASGETLPLPDPPVALNQEQRAAVLALDHGPVVLISGGPGTGKTSTVVELLRRAVAGQPDLRIGLAAPTGKAARRLADAVRPHLDGIPCATLHRWLEAGSNGRFRRYQGRPLELDLLVVDEMSMLDLALMEALLQALPSPSRLVLVGDPAQLPPVGSGSVWHVIQQPDVRARFGQGAVHLERTYRNRGAVAQLADCLRREGMAGLAPALAALPAESNVQLHTGRLGQLPVLLQERWDQRQQELAALAAGLDEVPEADLQQAATALLQTLEQELVLCPRRHGPWSLADVHRSLLGASVLKDPRRWPPGLPVICGSNQMELGLANGDLGVVVGLGDRQRLLFRAVDATLQPKAMASDPSSGQVPGRAAGCAVVRRLHPARLQVLEPAVALTIHRAQGSEADRVIVLWPDPPSADEIRPQDGRLLYTAITRARGSLDLITPE